MKRDTRGRYSQDRTLYRFFILLTGLSFVFILTFVGLRHTYEMLQKAYGIVVDVHNTSAEEPKSKDQIRDYLITAAKKLGIDENKVIWIVEHESMYDSQVVGDGGHSRGLWQIHQPSNPEVTIACAFSIECSTKWSLGEIKKGNINKWSAWKYRCVWYDYCAKKLK